MPQDLQSAKALFQDFNSARDAARPGDQVKALYQTFMSQDHRYRGMRPFYDISGPAALADKVWNPLKSAATTLQRRQDIVFASHHALDPNNPIWVIEMGNLLFDFTAPWLGIPATGKATYLPYATLSRIQGGRIVETVEFLDLLAVITQAGLNPFAKDQSGGHMMLPGPRTHDGIQGTSQDSEAAQASHDLSVDMLADLAKSYTSPADHMNRFWHSHMTWFGPTGIGSSLGFPGYRRGHTDSFETKLETVEIHDWELSIAEGDFSAVMWWPCLTMRNIDGYMGAPTNDALAEMRVVDLYRRQGDKLAENWIFIDMLHFLAEQGVDLLANLEEKS